MRFVDRYARYHVKLGIAGLALTAVFNRLGDRVGLFERGWWGRGEVVSGTRAVP